MSSPDDIGNDDESRGVRLVARRTIAAAAERLFDAWTEPAQLLHWWGPGEVECAGAEVDLQLGGHYRIANRFPDGRVVWISGKFLAIERPRKLVYTWQLGAGGSDARSTSPERVTVRFEPRGDATEVIVTHERVPDDTARRGHEQGWIGCLAGLAEYLLAST